MSVLPTTRVHLEPELQVQPAPSRSIRIGLAGALTLGPAALALLLTFPSLDLIYQSGVGHFVIVTGATLVALGLAALMLRAGVVRQDGRVLLIAAAFLALSTIFFVHAISTPGVLFLDTVHATTWSTPIALFTGGVLLALSALDRVATQRWLVKRWRRWSAIGFALWLGYALFMLWYVPTHVAHAVAPAAPPLSARMMALLPVTLPLIDSATVMLYSAAAAAYGRRLRRARTRPLLALTCGAVLLAETTIAAHLATLWHLSFWLYHLLLLAAVITVVYGIVMGYERYHSLSSAVEGLLLGTTLQRQRDGFARGMASLLEALEQRDATVLPDLRAAMRQRFGLAEDQIELVEHAVTLVAEEREEQRRLRALAEVSRAATLNLDVDLLLANAMGALATTTEATMCAVGLVQGRKVVFCRSHRLVQGEPSADTLTIPVQALPAAWATGGCDPLAGFLEGSLAPIAFNGGTTLVVPMHHHDSLLGVLAVQPRRPSAIGDRMVTVCNSIATHLSMAIANARLYQRLQCEHQDLLRSEQAREQLTQMVVHDLKNPLTAVRVNLDLLQMTGLSDEQQEMIEGAYHGSSIILQLISDMLDVARLEDGRIELRRVSTDAIPFLRGCVDELHAWSEQVEKRIVVAPAHALPPLWIDIALMRRVIINLLSNALKHTPAGVAITVGAAATAEAARLWVHDDGPGIPADQQQQLFERWSSAKTEDAHQSSTGLGLTFCKLAVETHGGTIHVDSAPGAGTTFTITMPLGPRLDQAAD